jgi:alkyldihydroxyacetonephosphate synthase
VKTAVLDTLAAVGAGGGFVSCRFTHVYPDGPAPYYTVVAPGRPGAELEQWDAVKAAASAAIGDAGGTATHHHAVGRDHRPGYDRERPELFAAVLRAAKTTLDPAGILNPGAVFDPD